MTELNIGLAKFEAQFEALKAEILKRPVFDDNSDTARSQRVERSRTDFLYFCRTYFPEYCTHGFAPFHKEWPRIRTRENEPWQVIAFRGAAKTALLNLLDALHAFIFHDVHFAVFGAYTEPKARVRTGRLLLELQSPRLRADFGEFRFGSAKPAIGNFVVHIPGARARSVAVWAISIGQDPRGLNHGPYRPDFVRLDDIQNRRRAKSRRLTKDAVEWITKDLLPALREPYSFGILATPLGGVETWLEKGKHDAVTIKTYRYPAEKGGRAAWKEYFPASRLRTIRGTIGSRAYNQEYKLVADTDDERPFKEDSIRHYTPLEVASKRYDYIVAWLDPSIKQGEKNDYKALVCVGGALDETHIDVLSAWIKRASIRRMIDAAYTCYDRHSPIYIYWEDNGGQGLLQESWDHAAERYGYYLPVRGETNSLAKEVRIEGTLSAPIENGVIRFHPTDKDQALLIDQLLDCFDGDHDDGPDALEGAVRKLQALLKRRRRTTPRSGVRHRSARMLSGY